MILTQLPSSPEILLIEAGFPSITPDTLFRYWTEPALLTQWWPQEAEVEPRVEGAYHLIWPAMDRHLRGHYTTFEPGKKLVFSWRWDHDTPELSTREVELVFMPLPTGGTRLQLTHGRYLNTPIDQEIRIEHHLAGWQHFLPRLEQARTTR